MTNGTNAKIEVCFTTSEAELLEGYKAASMLDGSGSSAVYLNLFLISIIAAACFRFDLRELGDLSLVALALVAMNAFWWAPRKAIRKLKIFTPGADTQITMCLDDSGVKLSNAVIESKILWEGFSRAGETPRLIVLFRGYHPTSIPKRALTEIQLSATRQLLSEKLPHKKNQQN